MGVFVGFILSSISSLAMSVIMFKAKTIKKVFAYFGIIGYSILAVYVTLVTFIPETESIAVMIAAPGGLLVLAWMFMIGIILIKASRKMS